MKYRKSCSQLATSIVLIVIAIPITSAQETSKPAEDQELKEVVQIARKAWAESEVFTVAGGKPSDPAHPNRKWAAQLWKYREEHMGTPAAARATAEALHLMFHADQVDELKAKADTLKPEDAAWDRVINVLMEAAAGTKEYAYFFSKAQMLLKNTANKDLRTLVRFNLGQAYWKKEELEQAKSAFEAVIDEAPDSSYAKRAKGNIHEIRFLKIGQIPPRFIAKSTSGTPISLSDYKGKALLLVFWASW